MQKHLFPLYFYDEDDELLIYEKASYLSITKDCKNNDFYISNFAVTPRGRIKISICNDATQTIYLAYGYSPDLSNAQQDRARKIAARMEDLQNVRHFYVDYGVLSPSIKENYDLDSIKVVAIRGGVYACLTFAEGNMSRENDMGVNLTKIQNQSERKDKNNMNMNNMFQNLTVGKANKSKYAISYLGTIAYNGKTYYNGQIYEVDGMTIPFDMLYFIPTQTVEKGDIIDKDGVGFYVASVENKTVTAINLETGKVETLLPSGPFGLSLYSKLFNPMGNVQGDKGFANLMMLQAFAGDNQKDGNMLMMMMLMQGNGGNFPFQFPNFGATVSPAKAKATVNTPENE